jgi:RNA polymerase sigma-70 factor (ECF subfamily)
LTLEKSSRKPADALQPSDVDGTRATETSRLKGLVALASSDAETLPVSKPLEPARAGELSVGPVVSSSTKRPLGQVSADSETPAIQLAPTVNSSDAELVRRARAGDAWAEEAVYRRYAARILALSKRLLADSAEAEDATQETFVTAFAAWKQLRDPDRLEQWLIQIAVSRVHRRFRRRKLLNFLGFHEPGSDASLDALARPDCPQEVRAELALIGKALDRLSAGERITWVLRHVEGMSLEEAAHESGCSLATAKRRIARATASIERFVQRSAR